MRYTNGQGPVDGDTEAPHREDTRDGSQLSVDCKHKGSCSRVKQWFKKYFWEGQSPTNDHHRAIDNLSEDAPWYEKAFVHHRRIIGLVVPSLMFHFFFWSMMIRHGWYYTFLDKWYLSATMVIGSIIAGMTCAGGGAVAFPVMTLAFSVAPSVARDVSIMIQSSGMGMASITIIFMRVQIEYVALGLCFFSGIAGTIFGLEVIDPLMGPSEKKMVFVSLWFGFAFVLYLLNRDPERKVYNRIPDLCTWKIIVLLVTGFIGGTFTGWAGSGMDLCVFSVCTTLFRLSEKIATPTSVILMASNSAVCLFWRALVINGVELEAWEFISVTAPIATIFAPFGSLIGTHFHRQVLAGSLYIVSVASLIGAFIVVKQTIALGCLSAGVMLISCTIFMLLNVFGSKLLKYTEYKKVEKRDKLNTVDEKMEALNGKDPPTIVVTEIIQKTPDSATRF